MNTSTVPSRVPFSASLSALQGYTPHLQKPSHGAYNDLVLFLIALFQVRTVNLSDLSVAMPSNAQASSCYKRLQRFFSGFELDYGDWANGMMNLIAIPHLWTLALDLREMERLSKLVALLTLEMVWAIRVGEWLTVQTPIPIKNQGRKAKVFFESAVTLFEMA